MPLHPNTVRHMELVSDAKENQYRAVGYDLTVGSIYIPKHGWFGKARQKLLGNQLVEEFEIPPQGVVVVFSQETVRMPEGVCGYAMPKTSQCSDGILVFNTGIVDPGYRGPLSGTTVNFSDTPYKLRKGDAFLRLVFETVSAPTQPGNNHPVQPFSDDERRNYQNGKIRRAIGFPATFLNVPETAEAVSKTVLSQERNYLLWVIGVFTVFLTVMTLSLAFIPTRFLPNTPTKEQIDLLAKEYSDRKDMQKTLDTFNAKIEGLEKKLLSAGGTITALEKRLLSAADTIKDLQSKVQTPQKKKASTP